MWYFESVVFRGSSSVLLPLVVVVLPLVVVVLPLVIVVLPLVIVVLPLVVVPLLLVIAVLLLVVVPLLQDACVFPVALSATFRLCVDSTFLETRHGNLFWSGGR